MGTVCKVIEENAFRNPRTTGICPSVIVEPVLGDHGTVESPQSVPGVLQIGVLENVKVLFRYTSEGQTVPPAVDAD